MKVLKKTISLLLILAMLFTSVVNAFADNSREVSVLIPTAHEVKISCGSHGRFSLGDDPLESGGSYNINRGDSVKITVVPDDGYELNVDTLPAGWIINGNEITCDKLVYNTNISIGFKKIDDGSGSLLPLIVLPAIVLIPTMFMLMGGSGESSVMTTSEYYKSLAPKTFGDVALTDFYAEAVGWGIDSGVIESTSAKRFFPALPCTRAAFVDFLYKAAGSPEVHKKSKFIDTKGLDIENAVIWAEENGITTGKDSKHFAPDEVITRGQAITFLYRYYLIVDKGKAELLDNQFIDVKDTKYYAQPVSWGVKNGIVQGIDKDRFAPETLCKRADVIVFLYRYFK